MKIKHVILNKENKNFFKRRIQIQTYRDNEIRIFEILFSW